MRNSAGDGAGCGRRGRGDRRQRQAAHLNGAAGDRGGQREEENRPLHRSERVGVSGVDQVRRRETRAFESLNLLVAGGPSRSLAEPLRSPLLRSSSVSSLVARPRPR